MRRPRGAQRLPPCRVGHPSLGALLLVLLVAGAAGVSAETWQEARTRHFLFIFEPRDRVAVDELLTFCEDVYTQITAFFGSSPELVPVIVRGRHDDANGATYSTPARIELYLTADMTQEFGSRTESWLRMLLTHELTHFVHQSMDTGFLHALSLVFGPSVAATSLDFLPYWAVEGPAVYDETVFTGGGRGRSALFGMYTKAPIEEGDIFSLGQAGYPSAFPPSGRPYVAGWMLVDWLEESYGPDTLRRIMDAYLDFPFFGPWDAIRSVTGKDADTVFAEMRAALVRRFAADAELPGGTRVSPDKIGEWTRPQPTARGLYVYRTGPEVSPAIVRLDPSTGAETALVRTTLTDSSSYSATPDGKTIVLSTLRVDSSRAAEERTTADIYSFDAVTGRLRRVTHDAHAWQPAVSPSGDEIVAVQGSGPYSRLVRVDPSTGALSVLFSREGGNVFTPSVSPDGCKVVFAFNLRGVQCLYVADLGALEAGSVALLDTAARVVDVNLDRVRAVVGPDPFGDYFPSFLDSGTILFSSDQSGSLFLYLVSLETGEVSLARRDPVAAIGGVADGDLLLYTSYASTGSCIKSVPIAKLDQSAVEPPPVPFPDPVPWKGAAVPARPWIDVPWPFLWAPQLTLITGPSTVDVGLGAAAYGGTLLDTIEWSADAGWLVGSAQPVAGISASTALGPITLGLSSALDYEYAGSWTESASTLLSLTWTLCAESALGSSSVLAVGTGLHHAAALTSTTPFSFGDSVTTRAPSWSSAVSIPVIVAGSWERAGSRLDFNPVLAVSGWAQATTFLPVLSLAAAAESLDVFAAVTLPSPVPHEALKLGVKSEMDVSGLGAPYTDSFTLPRGFPTARTRSADGGMLASVDYLVPVALLDQPLVLGFALTGLGMSMHAEFLADFSVLTPSLSVLPTLYLGADLTVRVAFNGLSFPLGVGLSAAVTPGAAVFDPANDLGVYLFMGFDSLGSSNLKATLHPAPTAWYTHGDAG